MKTPLVFSISPRGDEIARHVAQLLGAPVHLCGAGREDAAPLVVAAYAQGAPIVGVCAAGVLIRLLGTDLGDKVSEPPVLAVSADGKVAVPLLGSHRGANALARWIADGFRGFAAVTSLSDTLYEFSLDDPPPGYVVADPKAMRPLMAALLKGEKLRVEGRSGWLELAGYPVSDEGSQLLRLSESPRQGPGLLVHPQTVVVGLGCTSKAVAPDVIGLVETVLADADIAPGAVAALATIDSHVKTGALIEAAEHFGVPLRVFTRREIERERKRLETPSAAVEAATGLAGVCEAVALKAGTLIEPKRIAGNVTCALGKADTPIDISRFGKAAR
ncbi:cobalamin biosynthesis protein [Pelagibacterium sp. 26DY04]|uniref:cobalamin biosynthesis protein n=1 Tax=Pelagibacterium sp. 26DY04 TaxID=2967130 RepID=UPI0028159680|nr:cobalamin biosynthesis protein [Pelagibacterium sp. 26DY04]WMT87374.1 cobalamin biosynthesis protein [Pelagibacterium sp. 26DY04]